MKERRCTVCMIKSCTPVVGTGQPSILPLLHYQTENMWRVSITGIQHWFSSFLNPLTVLRLQVLNGLLFDFVLEKSQLIRTASDRCVLKLCLEKPRRGNGCWKLEVSGYLVLWVECAYLSLQTNACEEKQQESVAEKTVTHRSGTTPPGWSYSRWVHCNRSHSCRTCSYISFRKHGFSWQYRHIRMGFTSDGNPGVQAFQDPWAARKAVMPNLCHALSWSQASVKYMLLFAWLFNG